MRNQKKRFLLFFIIAVQCKYFPFFLIVPILFLIEKNILKLLAYISSPFLLMLLNNLIFNRSGMGGEAGNINNSLRNLAVGYTISYAENEISIQLIIFIAVCIYSYLKDTPKTNLCYWYVWLPLASSSIIFLLDTPYRWIFLTPFLTLIIIARIGRDTIERYYRRIAVEIVAVIACTVDSMIRFYWVYDFVAMKNMLIDRILPFRKFILHGTEQFKEFMTSESLYGLWTLLGGIFIVWLIGLLYYNHPDKYSVNMQTDYSETAQDTKKIDRMLVVRMIAFFAVTNHNIFSYATSVLLEIVRKIVLIVR